MTVEEKMAELVEAEKQRREARAVAVAERREAQRVADQARAEQRLRREAERLLAAENAPSRQVLGACWLCGSDSDLETGRVRFSLPLPLARIDGVLCSPCRGTPGDFAAQVTSRLWQERPELLERWGWKRRAGRPDPYAEGLSREEARRIAEAVEAGEYDSDSWSVAADPAALTWAHHLLEWRRAHSGDDKAKREPKPKSPFSWLR